MSTERNLLYIVGYPGSGKTTATALALGDSIVSVEQKPFAHTVYEIEKTNVVELGLRREPFGGTDCLALSVQPKVLQWLSEDAPDKLYDCSLVVGEGDRLGNTKFFTTAVDMGWRLILVYLKVPELMARRRAWERGSRFDEPWLKGRITKVNNLTQEYSSKLVVLDGSGPKVDVALKLQEVISNAGI